MIERGKMLAPMRVQTLQHDRALVTADPLRVHSRDLLVIPSVGRLDDAFANLAFLELGLALQPLGNRELERELGLERALEPCGVPLLFETAGRDVLLDQR